LEGVLRQAAHEWEERKVPLLARLYSAVAFETGVSAADAAFLVRLAGDLTYRQFVALATIVDPDSAVPALDEEAAGPAPGIEAELRNLADRGLIGFETKEGDVRHPSDLWGGPGEYRKWMMTPRGRLLAGLTGLDQLSSVDLERWQHERHGNSGEGTMG
jgi:hypothetical protein